MASGDTLISWAANSNEPPSLASSFATPDVRGPNTDEVSLLDFDAATDENAIFGGVMPRHYDGGGVTVQLVWAASTATSGNVVWNAAFSRFDHSGNDMDVDGFAAVNAVTDAAEAPSGAVHYVDITFTDGADMDSVPAGEYFRLRVTRDANNGSDTMAGDAELVAVEIRET